MVRSVVSGRGSQAATTGPGTGMGSLSLTPDTTFSVDGLTDKSRQDWSEETIGREESDVH